MPVLDLFWWYQSLSLCVFRRTTELDRENAFDESYR